MEEAKEVIQGIVSKQLLIEAVFSKVRNATTSHSKVKVRPIMLKQVMQYQFAYYVGTKVMHENVLPNEAAKKMIELLELEFKQAVFFTKEADIQVLISKKGKVAILRHKPSKVQADLAHNRKKEYVLEEGKPIPFLIELGVMNKEGKVLAKKYDKFKQINRFLELIQDIVPYLPQNRKVQIVDFGCGKSYLTFALYYYLKEIQQLDIHIIGLDLKADVITHCNRLCERFGYEDLRFLVGDIEQYKGLTQVDLVVTLHACDTATDAALEKAVRWDAGVILSVPCCQHELFNQVKNPILSPMLDHGIIKERFSALATDAVRAHILEIVGYKTQIVEFIDLEHTSKNLLIRAVKQRRSTELRRSKLEEYKTFKNFLQIDPYLERALRDRMYDE